MPTSPGDVASLHAILGFLISTFIPFLLLKYHNANASPFDDNNIMVLAFFIATLTYVAAMVTEFKFRIRKVECPNIITNISQLSATLASIFLVIIAFPYLGWFLFVIWIGFFIKLALDSYQEFSQLVVDPARCALHLIWNKLLRRETKKDEINIDQSSATSSTTSDSIV
ncbi:hypothetical protein REPUB_Repub05bG0027800 [Reevesia pubescens]